MAAHRRELAKRTAPAAKRIPRAAAQRIQKQVLPVIDPDAFLRLQALPSPIGLQAGPYVDYSRTLTPEGGVRITYKDLDWRLRFILWRVLAWTAFTGLEYWLLFHYSPVRGSWINVLCVVVMALVNLLIVWKPPETYRSVEIRPDCMIVEGKEVFWLDRMENGFPALQRKDESKHILCGVYGTRFVEYLTVRQFDENDRTPEVFAAHLADAMHQLWEPASKLGQAKQPQRRQEF